MYLDDIVTYKREEVKGMALLDGVRRRGIRNPVETLKDRPFIAEIKKASPSRGIIKQDINPAALARSYEAGGAGAVSVLTDTHFFSGGFDVLDAVAYTVALPALCKDFIISELQIENAFIAGADFILLIACILSEQELKALSMRAVNLGMKVLFELHEPDELKKIKKLGPELVGINARDLKTFKIDMAASIDKIRRLEGGFIKVAESGINTAEDVRAYRDAGVDAFLVGSALMEADDPGLKLREFYSAL